MRRSVVPAVVGVLASIASLAASAAGVSTADLARCASVTAPDARLACYDELAATVALPPGAAAAAASGVSGLSGAATARVAPTAPTAPTAPLAPLAPTAAAGPAAPGAPVAPAPPDPNDPRNFGLTPAQLHSPPAGPQVLHVHIAALSEGAHGQTSVVLDNGQTWVFVNDDFRLRAGDALTIKRAALGSFLIVTPSNHTLQARRTQ